MHDNKGRKTRWNIYPMILCGLVFFVITATIFCMVVNSREAKEEAKKEQLKAEQLAAAEEQKKEEEEAKAEEEEARKESFKIQPGVPIGTTEPQDEEKVVYLTFDDGPSKNTQPILDILEQYGAKATFFITGGHEDCRQYILLLKRISMIWNRSAKSQRNRSAMCRVLFVSQAERRIQSRQNILWVL